MSLRFSSALNPGILATKIDTPASASASDHVEVVARLRRRFWVDRIHELLQDLKRRQAADAAAIEGKQAEVVLWHGWKGEQDGLAKQPDLISKMQQHAYGSTGLQSRFCGVDCSAERPMSR